MSITSKGKGKSVGARVITLTTLISKTDVILLTIYDKSECENLTDNELKDIINKSGL